MPLSKGHLSRILPDHRPPCLLEMGARCSLSDQRSPASTPMLWKTSLAT